MVLLDCFLCVDSKENPENDFHFQSCNVALLCHIEIYTVANKCEMRAHSLSC